MVVGIFMNCNVDIVDCVCFNLRFVRSRVECVMCGWSWFSFIFSF